MVMNNKAPNPYPPLRLSAWLLLAGQLLYIAVTQLHAAGDANDHPAIFAEYARNGGSSVVALRLPDTELPYRDD
jgi:hypothetical protein